MARKPQAHKHVWRSYGAQAAALDVGIADLVLFVWQRGMRTFASCEGGMKERPYLCFYTYKDAQRLYTMIRRVGNTYAPRFDADADDHGDPFESFPLEVHLHSWWFGRPRHAVSMAPKDLLPKLVEALEILFPLKDEDDGRRP
jgi:hypothetical protein